MPIYLLKHSRCVVVDSRHYLHRIPESVLRVNGIYPLGRISDLEIGPALNAG